MIRRNRNTATVLGLVKPQQRLPAALFRQTMGASWSGGTGEYEEATARAAAEGYLTGQAVWAHPEVENLSVNSAGELSSSGRSVPQSVDGQVLSVHVLPGSTAAAVQVEWGDRAGWLTLLKHENKWAVISCVVAPTTPTWRTTPTDISAVSVACWDEYCAANRACNGEKMAGIFHALCRLTETDASTGRVAIFPQATFCRMVNERYSSPRHAPFAHLQDDPRVAARDSLLSVRFASESVAMVSLKVGHAPCLWTDLLTLAKLEGGRWWIVAKSSCSEPLLADEAR